MLAPAALSTVASGSADQAGGPDKAKPAITGSARYSRSHDREGSSPLFLPEGIGVFVILTLPWFLMTPVFVVTHTPFLFNFLVRHLTVALMLKKH
jgi:hypothetical protein